jgi:membrane-associated phospholipid phosphatase
MFDNYYKCNCYMQSILQSLIAADKKLEYFINRNMQNSVFDGVLPFLREPLFWAPLFLFIIALMVQQYKWKGLLWLLTLILVVGITDQISSNYLKGAIGRLRPCRDPETMLWVIVRVKYCPGSGSFTSSHAANHFAIAMFMFGTLKNYFNRIVLKLLFVWAALICLAQMYVGVHYPLDILGGGILGLITGSCLAWLFNKRLGLVNN